MAKTKAKPAVKISAKAGKAMRKELKMEQDEATVQDAGLKSMGYKKGGMVKAKPKGYKCGGKGKK